MVMVMNDLLPPPLCNVNRPSHSEIQLFQNLTMKSMVKVMCVVKDQAGFPRLLDYEIPGLFQDFSRTFPRTLFFHIMPLADGDVYGKYDTRIGEVI